MTDDLPDHTNYSLIKAVDESGNLVTVLCDASGRIVSVMKGDYAGTMKTLAVDNKGRIQAVLTDPEDVFGNPNYIGAGELAARLGSIKNFENRGQVVWMDDFEGPVLRWGKTEVGTGAAVALSTSQSLSGIQSAKLTAGTGSSGQGAIYRTLGQPRSTKLGIELAFTTEEYVDHINIKATLENDIECVYGWFKVDFNAQKIYYYDDNAAWITAIDDPEFKDNDSFFRRLKFVFDYGTSEWIRAYFDAQVADLNNAPMKSSYTAGSRHLELDIALYGDETHNSSTYIDNVIVTQNEP